MASAAAAPLRRDTPAGPRRTGRQKAPSADTARRGAGADAAAVTPPLPPKPEPVNDLHELTRVQLLERARTAEIRGRSSMSKEQLVTALRATS